MKMEDGKMIMDTKSCTGCRTCEIACSFHHRGIFSPGVSSIEIVDRWKELGFGISFYERDQEGHLSCDGCKALDEPMCVKYCNVIMREELRTLLKRCLSTRRVG